MTRTANYDLIVVEGNDKVNLLTQMNPNTEKIDEVMKTNENSGVHAATELLSGTIHAITRTVKTASMFKFTAVSNYTSGDTFTVDGVQVTALLTSGEALGTGAYIIGSEVLCSLKDTLLTIYTQGGTVKIAEDANKLGGNLPEYYASKSELDNVKSVAESASSLSRQNSESINDINKNISLIGSTELLGYVDSGKSKVDTVKNFKNFKFIYAFLWNTASNSIYGSVTIPTSFLSINTPFYVNFYDGAQSYIGTVNFLSNTQVSIDGTKSNGLQVYVHGVK